jgi:hypothetical protein
LAFDLLLIFLYLLILPVIFIFLTLELVTDERTGAKSQTTTNCSTRTWATDCSTNEPACRRTTKGADASSLFSCCQRPTRTTHEQKRRQNKAHIPTHKFALCIHRQFLLLANFCESFCETGNGCAGQSKTQKIQLLIIPKKKEGVEQKVKRVRRMTTEFPKLLLFYRK